MSKITFANRKITEEQIKLMLNEQDYEDYDIDSVTGLPSQVAQTFINAAPSVGKSLATMLKSVYRDVEHRFFKNNITQAIVQRDDNLKNIEEIKMFLSTFQDSKFFGAKVGSWIGNAETKSFYGAWWNDPQTYFATDVLRPIRAFKKRFKTEIENLENNENRLEVYRKYTYGTAIPGFEYSDEIVQDSARKNMGLDVLICRNLKIVQFYEKQKIIVIKKDDEAKDILTKTRDAFEDRITKDPKMRKDWVAFAFAMALDPRGQIDIKFFEGALEEHEGTESVDTASKFIGLTAEFVAIDKSLKSLKYFSKVYRPEKIISFTRGGFATLLLFLGAGIYNSLDEFFESGMPFSKKRQISNHLDSIIKELKNISKNHRGTNWRATDEENKRVKNHIEKILTIYHELFVKVSRENIYSATEEAPDGEKEIIKFNNIIKEISNQFYDLKENFFYDINFKNINSRIKAINNIRTGILIPIKALTDRINNLSLIDEEKQMKIYNNKDIKLLVSEVINKKQEPLQEGPFDGITDFFGDDDKEEPPESGSETPKNKNKEIYKQLNKSKDPEPYDPDKVVDHIKEFLSSNHKLNLELKTNDYVRIINRLKIRNLNDIDKFISFKPIKIPEIKRNVEGYQAGWYKFWSRNFFEYQQMQGLDDNTIQWILSSAFAEKGGLYKEYRSRSGLLKAQIQPAEIIAMVGPFNGTKNSCFLFFSRRYELPIDLLKYGTGAGGPRIEKLRDSRIVKEGWVNAYLNNQYVAALAGDYEELGRLKEDDIRSLDKEARMGFYRIRELLASEIQLYKFLRNSIEGIFKVDDDLTDLLVSLEGSLSSVDIITQASSAAKISNKFKQISSLKIANFERVAFLEKELEKLGIQS